MGLTTVSQVRAAGFGSPGWDQSTYSDALIQRLIIPLRPAGRAVH